jgi:CRP/FNR family transcriptional regulator, cyclic AMP receptor protein
MLDATMDKTDLLATLPIFAKLHPRSLQAVAALAVEDAAPAGTELMREGEAADAFFVIVSGTVRIERGGRTVRSLTDGGFLGEIALLEDGDRTASATCATDCSFIRLGSHEFRRVVETFPDVRARVEAAVARRPRGDGA